MIRYIVSLVIVISLIVISGMGILAEDMAKMETPAKPVIAQEASKAKVAVDENILVSLADMPIYHVKRAREYFLKKDSKEAANEIRISEIFVNLQSERVTTEASKKALWGVARRLDKLASDIEKGSVGSINEFNYNVSLAGKELVNCDTAMADMVIANIEIINADSDSKLAINYNQHGYNWTAQRKEKKNNEIKVKHKPKIAANYIQNGYNWSTDRKEKKSDNIKAKHEPKVATSYNQHGYNWIVDGNGRKIDEIKADQKLVVVDEYTQHGYVWSMQEKSEEILGNGQTLVGKLMGGIDVVTGEANDSIKGMSNEMIDKLEDRTNKMR